MACVNVISFTVERCQPRPCTPRNLGECGQPGIYDWTGYLDNETLLRRTVAARTPLYVSEALTQECGMIHRRSRNALCLKHAGLIGEAFLPEGGIPAMLLVLIAGYTLVGSIRFDASAPLEKRMLVQRMPSGVNMLFDRLHELNWHYDRSSLRLVRLDHCAEMEQTG